MFSEQEQEEIINQFLDVIKVQDYITNSKLQRKKGKCNDYKQHDMYCVLSELPLPENILSNIHNFTYSCCHCDKKEKAKEEQKERIETNDLFLYNVDKLFLSASESFPCYDIVQKIIKNITPKRHRKFERLFSQIMDCKDNNEIKTYIEYELKLDVATTRRDFNKIIRRVFDEPDFDLLE